MSSRLQTLKLSGWAKLFLKKNGIINRFMADKHKIFYFTLVYLSFGRKEEKHFLSQRLIKAFYFNHVLGAMHSFAVFVSIIIIIVFIMLSSATGTLTEYWFSGIAQINDEIEPSIFPFHWFNKQWEHESINSVLYFRYEEFILILFRDCVANDHLNYAHWNAFPNLYYNIFLVNPAIQPILKYYCYQNYYYYFFTRETK